MPEKGDWKTRVGIKAPEQVPALMHAVFNNPPYNDPFAPLDSLWYMSFYENYKKLTDYAPYADYAFYNGVFSEAQTYKDKSGANQAVSIYERLIVRKTRRIVYEEKIASCITFVFRDDCTLRMQRRYG